MSHQSSRMMKSTFTLVQMLKHYLLCRIKMFAVWEIYSTLIWYLTLPAKCWMTKVSSVFEEGTKNGLSWCCCFNLSNRVSSVAWGRLTTHKEISTNQHLITGTEKRTRVIIQYHLLTWWYYDSQYCCLSRVLLLLLLFFYWNLFFRCRSLVWYQLHAVLLNKSH